MMTQQLIKQVVQGVASGVVVGGAIVLTWLLSTTNWSDTDFWVDSQVWQD